MFYPALDIENADSDRVLAIVDDYSPTAIEERSGTLTIFFSNGERRDAACEALLRALPGAIAGAREVDDEDWGRRSQQSLTAITVGRITIAPPWAARGLAALPGFLAIEPSMGFGTGHHATTRLCLEALQKIDLAGATVFDIGTGSGVLALAARRLGASRAVGIDRDPDAVQAANENLRLNPDIDAVVFEVAGLAPWLSGPGPGTGRRQAGAVTANLTGALLTRAAPLLMNALVPGGSLVISGMLAPEHDAVLAAFGPMRIVWESTEDGWVGAVLRFPTPVWGPPSGGRESAEAGSHSWLYQRRSD